MRFLGIFIFVLCVPIFLATAEDKDLKSAQGMRYPAWSPDGNSIAFCLSGDIWKIPAQGGQAVRLTLHEADDLKPRWSPDGKYIAFSSNRNGNFDVWVIPSQGGTPRQITFHSEWDSISDWTSDGKWIVFFSYRSGGMEIWKVRPEGGIPVQITFDGGRDASVSPDGTKIVYTRGEASLWIKGYQGSSNWDIYSTSLEKGEPSVALTTFQGNDLSPFFSHDGKAIYFIREDLADVAGKQTMVYNLWKMDLDGKNAARLSSVDFDIMNPHPSKDGQKIIYEKNFQLWQMSLSDFKETAIPVHIFSDKKSDQESTKIVSEGSEMGHWSPDSSQIVFVLQGDIWLMPSHGGMAIQLTKGPAKDQWPRFSPDGKSIAYFSNKSGNDDIYILELSSKKERQLTNHKSNDFFHSWAPDGKTIIFTSERSGNRDIWAIPSEGGIERQITNSPESEDDAVYSPDGEWIAFDSAKDGNQEIWIMPSNEDYSQAKQLTKQGGLTQVPSWSSDSRWIAFENNDTRGNSSIWLISLQGGQTMQVVNKATLPMLSPNGKWLMYESEKEGIKNLHTIEAPKEIVQGKRIPFYARQESNLKQERLDIFEEAWSAIEKDFYDPKFHGVNWLKTKEKYLPLIEDCETDMELYVLINRMVGELGASHMGITPEFEKNKASTGELGWTLEEVEGIRGLRVKNVLKDGPADKAWIRKGDYVFQIHGSLITRTIQLDQILNNTIDQEVRVFISPTKETKDGRYVKVVPTSINKIEEIKYYHWLNKRVEIVKQISSGRIVYIHLREMNHVYLRKFLEIIQKTVEKADGMILDVRNNGGGNIHQELIDVLMRRPFVQYQVRDKKMFMQPELYWDKPVVVLINERSFSDAEVFPYAFQVLRRGYVVGMPTSGGVIGTKDITLSNKSIFRVPQVGYYTLDNKNLEGFGVKPDFIVPETPEDRQEDRDPQLLKAIQIMVEEISQSKKEVEKKETPEKK